MDSTSSDMGLVEAVVGEAAAHCSLLCDVGEAKDARLTKLETDWLEFVLGMLVDMVDTWQLSVTGFILRTSLDNVNHFVLSCFNSLLRECLQTALMRLPLSPTVNIH